MNNESLALEDGTHRLSRNFGNYQPMVHDIPGRLSWNVGNYQPMLPNIPDEEKL